MMCCAVRSWRSGTEVATLLVTETVIVKFGRLSGYMIGIGHQIGTEGRGSKGYGSLRIQAGSEFLKPDQKGIISACERQKQWHGSEVVLVEMESSRPASEGDCPIYRRLRCPNQRASKQFPTLEHGNFKYLYRNGKGNTIGERVSSKAKYSRQ